MSVPQEMRPMVTTPYTHPNAERLKDFALGKLPDSDAAQVADHLAECPPCQEAVASVPDDSVLRLVRSAPPSSVSGTAEALLSGAATDSWVPPELIGHPRYRLLEWLGAGGMGVVFKAQHRLMDRTVAIKVISKKLTTNATAVERFEREVRAAARLSHPNIVAAFDAERAGDLHFLVMEFVEGTNLARLVEEKGRLPVDLACDYARQAASGLQHAFEQGMVHRDIKPSNLMVTDKGVVKILDFGVAGFVNGDDGPQTEFGATLGTPSYMSPEQARDARSSDIRADIYSLGCTLYFLLMGRSPSPLSGFHNVADPTALLRADLPKGLVQVLGKMLAREPAQRFQTPAEVVQALSPYVAKEKSGAARKVLAGILAIFVLGLGGPILSRKIVSNQGSSKDGERPAPAAQATFPQTLRVSAKLPVEHTVEQKPEPKKPKPDAELKGEPANPKVEHFAIGEADLQMTTMAVNDRQVKFLIQVRNVGSDFKPITAWLEKHSEVFQRKIKELGLGMGTWDAKTTSWPPRFENGVASFEIIFSRR